MKKKNHTQALQDVRDLKLVLQDEVDNQLKMVPEMISLNNSEEVAVLTLTSDTKVFLKKEQLIELRDYLNNLELE